LATIRVSIPQRIPADIPIGVEATAQPDGIALDVAPEAGVVVAVVVVLEPLPSLAALQ